MKNEIDKTVERIKQRGDDHRLYCPTCKAGRNCMDHLMIRENDLQEQVTQLKAELATAKQGLEHYADEMNWNLNIGNSFGMTGESMYTFGSSAQNGYDNAKAALDKIGKE